MRLLFTVDYMRRISVRSFDCMDKRNKGYTLIQVIIAAIICFILVFVVIPTILIGKEKKAEADRFECAVNIEKVFQRVLSENSAGDGSQKSDGIVIIRNGKGDDLIPFSKLIGKRLKEAGVGNLDNSEIMLVYRNNDMPVSLTVAYEKKGSCHIYKYVYDEEEKALLRASNTYDSVENNWFKYKR